MKDNKERNSNGFDVKLVINEPVNVYKAHLGTDAIKMAGAANVFNVIWNPENFGVSKASDIAPHLERGIEILEKDPDFYKSLQSEEKWSTYENFLAWLKRYLSACRNHPNAEIHIDRNFLCM
jgi:hypothetical protein